jgi:hypothetical protein
MAQNWTHDVNCTALTLRSSFPNYVQSMRIETENNFTRLDACKAEVCNALWGVGNSDISGIGVWQHSYPPRPRLKYLELT